jgi:uncharacterized protein (TIGR02145 family)
MALHTHGNQPSRRRTLRTVDHIYALETTNQEVVEVGAVHTPPSHTTRVGNLASGNFMRCTDESFKGGERDESYNPLVLLQDHTWSFPPGEEFEPEKVYTGIGALYNWYAVTKSIDVYEEIYGALYNWYAASYNNNGVTLAPTGWHVPTRTDYDNLLLYLDPTTNVYSFWTESSITGGMLKETGEDNWLAPNTDATNSSGFTAQGAGVRVSAGFQSALDRLWLWTSSNSNTTEGYMCQPGIYNGAGSITASTDKTYGCSIRLIKDNSTNPGTVTDYDGNTYNTVKIGDQIWTLENIKVQHYNDGTPIPIISDQTLWNADTSGALCYYDNQLLSSSINFGITGWHVPTIAELQDLATELTALAGGGPYGTGGGALKVIGFIDWNAPNTGATNITGFNAKGVGWRLGSGSGVQAGEFTAIKEFFSFWSSEIFFGMNPIAFSVYYNDELFQSYNLFDPDIGLSIRLLKDDSIDPGQVVDVDGNIYPTVKIGSQVWTTVSFKCTHYIDGTPIPLVEDNTDWVNDTAGAMCYYDNIEA